MHGPRDEPGEVERTSRRQVLRSGAVGAAAAAAAWSAPAVLSIDAATAATPPLLGPPELRALLSGVFTTSDALASPAATAAGDRLLLILAVGAGFDLVTSPAGMAVLHSTDPGADEPEVHLFEKAAVAGGESLAFSCSPGGTIAAALVVYRPGTGGTSVGVDGSDVALSGPGTTHAYPALPAGAANRRIVRLGGAGWLLSTGDWLTAPAADVRLLTSLGGPHAATVQVSDEVDAIGTADGTTSTVGLAVTHSVALITVA